jgi:hypothetical protein
MRQRQSSSVLGVQVAAASKLRSYNRTVETESVSEKKSASADATVV